MTGSGAMISCREAVERLWSFIDGELDASDAGRVEAHLDACRGCSPQHDYQRAFREFLRRHAEKPVPADLRKRVFMSLLREDQGVEGG